MSKASVFAILILVLGMISACVSRNSPKGPDETKSTGAAMRRFAFEQMPLLATIEGKRIHLGGFSGLIFEGRDSTNGDLNFLTHTDRGPNFPAPKTEQKTDTQHTKNKSTRFDVVFPMPQFQPEWVGLALNEKTGRVRVVWRKGLSQKNGRMISGLPNSTNEEAPQDSKGKKLSADPLGLDLESIAHSLDGSYWMGDEYRPSLVHLTAQGRLIERYIPIGSPAASGKPVLPKSFGKRRPNRGFEGIGLQGKKVYGFLQSALEDKKIEKSDFDQVVRVVEFNSETSKATGEYLYLMQDRNKDWKIGDVASLPDGSFLVLEQTSATGENADKKIYRVRLDGATNLTSTKGLSDEALDSLTPEQLAARNVVPMKKELIVDLAAIGLRFAAKVEGLASVDKRTLALVSDNDFGTGEEAKSELVLIDLGRELY